MSRPTAVIDRSLLQEICKQAPEIRNSDLDLLNARYQIVIPQILVEEVWVYLSKCAQQLSTGESPLEEADAMANCLHALRDHWIADPLEIAFSELVEKQSVEILPKPPEKVLNSFHNLVPGNAALAVWVKDRERLMKRAARQRTLELRKIFGPNKFVPLKTHDEFFALHIRPKLARILSDASEKKRLLEIVLGQAFRKRHPESTQQIERALQAYDLDSLDQYPVTRYCILTWLFYFYAPMFRLSVSKGGSRPNLIARGSNAQVNNYADEQYVRSALLCARLLTRDKGMFTMVELFRTGGLAHCEGRLISTQCEVSPQLITLPI